jgi:hypothetical protein
MPLHSLATSITIPGRVKLYPSREKGMPDALKRISVINVDPSRRNPTIGESIFKGIGEIKNMNATENKLVDTALFPKMHPIIATKKKEKDIPAKVKAIGSLNLSK